MTLGRSAKFNDKEKWCPKCLSWKVLDEFNNNNYALNPSGKQSTCKVCHATTKLSRVCRKLGTTFEERTRMWESQGRKCAICEAPILLFGGTHATGDLANFDHNHQTNTPRGLLCNLCNRGLGLFQDSATLLTKAANYLNLYSVTS